MKFDPDSGYEVFRKDGKYLVKEKSGKYKQDSGDRLFDFATDTFRFLKTLPAAKEYDDFRYQLSKSATSVGANYEEAQGAFSTKEFTSKISICLKEARETNYFYRLILNLQIGDAEAGKRLLSESHELKIFLVQS
ncbi:MAG: four helix bundle protein [Calditrichia bacterium]